MSRMRSTMITGILTLTPIALSIYIMYRLFILLDQLLGRFLAILFEKKSVPYIPGLGFLLLLVLIFLVGLFARVYLGRKLISIGEWFLNRIPVLSKLALAIRQILESFLTDNNELFRNSLLLEYPRKGVWAVGFMTRQTGGEVREKLRTPNDNKLLSVFVPTTPNPTSGVLVFIPEADVVYLDMSVEDALKLVVSGGALCQAIERNTQLGKIKAASTPSTDGIIE
jgi:uncharacterized membrane protein